jgi:hypothetical protein
MTEPTNLDSTLAKIQGLLAVADDPATTPEAAENYRAKAEALMFKYRIDEAMLGVRNDQGNIFRPEPVWRTFRICKAGNEFRHHYEQIAVAALGHVDARCVRDYEDGWHVIHAVGYDSDLRFAELIFTAGMLAFGTKLEPRYDPNLSDQVNAYNMRSAGWEGKRIAQAIWGSDDKALRVKARKLFRREAAERGEDVEGLTGRGVSVEQFRKDYAAGFADEFWSRLWRMRQEHAQDERGLVLADRKDKVEEALYARYPHLRPRPAGEAGTWVDPTKECQRCQAAKSGYCREHSYLRPSQARPRAASYSAAGAQRGRAAARTVDLGAQQRPRANSAERTALG